jgi:hypothetical protein
LAGLGRTTGSIRLKSSPPAVPDERAEAVVRKNGFLLHITAPQIIFEGEI